MRHSPHPALTVQALVDEALAHPHWLSASRGIRGSDWTGRALLDALAYRHPEHLFDDALHLGGHMWWLYHAQRAVLGPVEPRMRVAYHGVRLHHLIRSNPLPGAAAVRALLDV